MIFVIDASVFVKWVVQEPGSEQAALLMREPVTAPALLVPECMNILWKKVARGELSEAHAHAAARALRGAGVVLETAHDLAGDILALSLRLGHPAYDCTYLALARKLGGVMVTADDRFLRRCLQPDAADLAPHIQSLFQVGGNEVHEPRRGYGYRRRRAA